MLLKHLVSRNEHFVWDAVVAWRDRIYTASFRNNTKANYLTSMLKLIESDILDVRLPLTKIDDEWFHVAKKSINEAHIWSKETKSIRKSCLNTFYNFVRNDFDYSIEPYRRHPKPNEIKHILSSVMEKALTESISPTILCNSLSKINERDAYITWLMMQTGRTLEQILDLPKESLKAPYLHFKDGGEYIFSHIVEALDRLCKNSKVYLFETANNRRIRRTQVMRNLKQAGHSIGLSYDLTPRLIHGYTMGYMSADKRSELEKALGN